MIEIEETRKPRVALVLGSAANLEEDTVAALKLFVPSFVIAAGNAARFYVGHVDAWAKAPPRLRDGPGRWRTDLEARGYRKYLAGRDSGAKATMIALIGYADKVVLAGLPESAEFGHLTGAKHGCSRERLKQWQLRSHFLGDRVRSMSGATADLLGTPDADWLAATVEPISWEPGYPEFWRPHRVMYAKARRELRASRADRASELANGLLQLQRED